MNTIYLSHAGTSNMWSACYRFLLKAFLSFVLESMEIMKEANIFF